MLSKRKTNAILKSASATKFNFCLFFWAMTCETSIFNAIRNNNIDDIVHILQQDEFDINATDEISNSLL